MSALRVSVLALFLCSAVASAQTTRPAVTIRVEPGERQTFGGFGSSVANFNGFYEKLPPGPRAELNRLVWTDLKFSILRLWMQTFEYSSSPGDRDMTVFRKQYIDSGIIADAQKAGVRTLLLAPDNLPTYMRQTAADGGISLRPEFAGEYAKLISDFIVALKRDHGLTIDVTGIQNEPSDEQKIHPPEMTAVVRHLRVELDRRGFRQTKIIATENANVNDIFLKELQALKADPAAWAALAGVASHSYNMAATEEVAKLLGGKDYWMTEASEGGPEKPGDARRAMAVSARFLNDVNHGVTHWIHFLAYENVRADDNGTCILNFTNDPPAITTLYKHHTFKQLVETFEPGAVFRHCTSSAEGEMTWTYGQKPRITAAAARNADGGWAIGVVNFTADDFLRFEGWGDEKWKRGQGGHTPATTYTVTLAIDELKDAAPMKLALHRTNGAVARQAEQAELVGGRVTVTVGPMELVTLRSLSRR
jgi:O-glycosyl hydrolase